MRKTSLFNYLAGDNRVFTLKIFAKKKSNKLLVIICTLCHAVIVSVDYLFFSIACSLREFHNFAKSFIGCYFFFHYLFTKKI